MVVDCVTFNGEYDLFDLRYNILKDYVDEFIVVEFNKTFSGKDKQWYFEGIKDKYKKVNYWQFTPQHYSEYMELALSSPNTEYGKGAQHWIREFCQKECIRKALTHLKGEDIVFIGDCDEIWDPDTLKHVLIDFTPVKLRLKVYTYYLNNVSNEKFYGPIVGLYAGIRNNVLNHLRTTINTTYHNFGWHFTSMANDLKRKLEDSYTKETYANDWVIQHLEDNVKDNKDFLGRDFTYKVDESGWPQYLKENKQKYKHLLKSA